MQIWERRSNSSRRANGAVGVSNALQSGSLLRRAEAILESDVLLFGGVAKEAKSQTSDVFAEHREC